jgi:hypothetical protein
VASLTLGQRAGGIGFLVLISLLLVSVTQVAAQSVPCHLYTYASTATDPSPFPSGFGVPWNVFSPSELLLQAACTNTGITAPIGPATYVYHQGYTWDGSNWQLLQLTCTGGAKVSNAWCPNTAQGTLPASASYYVAYTCNWINSRWYCGCRDTVCTQNLWQLQRYQATTPSTTTLVGTWTGTWQSFIVGRGGGTLTLTIISENQLGQTGSFQWTGTLTRTGPERSNITNMPVSGTDFIFSGTPLGEFLGCEADFAADSGPRAPVVGGIYEISSLCRSLDVDAGNFTLQKQ